MTDRRSDLDFKAVRGALETERSELRAASQALVADRKPVILDQQSVGRLSRMDALQVQAMSKAQESRRQARMLAIDAALKRLEDGAYGYCAECGDDIPAKRLDVDPVTPRCIECMS